MTWAFLNVLFLFIYGAKVVVVVVYFVGVCFVLFTFYFFKMRKIGFNF